MEVGSLPLIRGRKVYSGLYGGRHGIVFAVHGVPSPESVIRVGGIMSAGGRATVDVVFDSGTISRQIPESIVYGVQWKIYDEIATDDEIIKAIQFAELEEARRATEAEQAAARREAEKVSHAANNPHLTSLAQKPAKWTEHRLVAANIRIELKRNFPGVKFTVTSEYGSVNVRWVDGPTSEQVKEFTGKFEIGSFNGMDDSYEYDRNATFANVFGGVKYVFETRDRTIEGIRKAWEKAGFDPKEIPDDFQRNPIRTGIDTEVNQVYYNTDLR